MDNKSKPGVTKLISDDNVQFKVQTIKQDEKGVFPSSFLSSFLLSFLPSFLFYCYQVQFITKN
jgi:hypothetical protein